jgi:hypothetical protein
MIHLFGVGRRCEALATEATEGLREVHHQLIPGRAIAKTAGQFGLSRSASVKSRMA